MLYSFARNPLTHALGLDAARVHDPLMEIGKGPLTSCQILQLEDESDRPEFTLPTIYEYERLAPGDDRYVIDVRALYWGVHRMLRALFSDETQATAAEVLAAELNRREAAREEARRGIAGIQTNPGSATDSPQQPARGRSSPTG